MRSGRPERFVGYALLCALCGTLISSVAASAQETRCAQHKPREGDRSKTAEEYIEQGRKQETSQEGRGYFGYALDVLKRGMEEEPDNSLHYFLAGQVSLELGDYVGADTLWDRAACLWEPYTAQIDGLRLVGWGNALREAEALSTSGDTLAAMQLYLGAYAIHDSEPHPIFTFAVHCVTQAQLVESDSAKQAYLADAIWGFREVIAATRRSDSLSDEERREFYASGTANLAQILAYQDRVPEAAEVYEQYLVDNPDDARARSRLASFLAMQINDLQDSMQQMQDSAEQAEMRARINSLDERVSQQYSDLLAAGGAVLEAAEYHDVGIALYQLERWEEAAMAFRKALEIQPYRPESLELLAHSLYAADHFDALVTVAKQLVDRYPYDTNSLALLANAYRETEKSDQALAVFERREALPFQLAQLDMRGGAASGSVENLKLEPGTPIEVEFTFYDDAGNVIGTGGLSISAPEVGAMTSFRVEPEAAAGEASGFTYRVESPT